VDVHRDEVASVVEVVLERLRRARDKLADVIAQRGPDGLGEILGDLNFSVARLEEALKLLERRGP
jgi:uncharacterized protein (UPF0548 family)